MIKELKKTLVGMNKEFRFRGEEQSRIETVSDAGFALSIGLLLISVSSPSNFEDLIAFTKDLVPFAMCIALIMLVWYQHFIFFLRYGLKNARIVALNTILIFIILFYVYPLKFLAKTLSLIYGGLIRGVMGFDADYQELGSMITKDQMPTLMVIYGIGATAVFLTLAFMYRYAYNVRDELELNEVETFDTKVSIQNNFLMALVPFLSVIVALAISSPVLAGTIAGFTYWLYFPIMAIHSKRAKKKRNVLLNRDT